MGYILEKCQRCGALAQLETVEIAEDDEWKYTFEMYKVCCTNWDCPNETELQWYEEDAVEEWNNTEDEK